MRSEAPGGWKAIAVVTALALVASGCPADPAAERRDLLATIEALAGKMQPARADHERMAEVCRRYLASFEGEEDAPRVRRRLGLALFAAGDDAGAARELAAVTETAKPGDPFRSAVLHELATAETARGDPARARALLERIVAEAPRGEYAKKAKADLRDLDRIGKPAPIPRPGPSADPEAVELRRSGTPPLYAGAARAIEVAGWDDPRLKDWPVPTLPRVYVVDAHGIVRAAGVRGAAIEAALAAARCPCAGCP